MTEWTFDKPYPQYGAYRLRIVSEDIDGEITEYEGWAVKHEVSGDYVYDLETGKIRLSKTFKCAVHYAGYLNGYRTEEPPCACHEDDYPHVK